MKPNPKEKAKEIFQTILCFKDPLSKYPMCFDTAKQASIFLVEEILEATIKYVAVREKTYKTKTNYENVVHSVYDEYWKEVLKEIELIK